MELTYNGDMYTVQQLETNKTITVLATGDVATHGAVMYPQNASLDQVPWHSISN